MIANLLGMLVLGGLGGACVAGILWAMRHYSALDDDRPDPVDEHADTVAMEVPPVVAGALVDAALMEHELWLWLDLADDGYDIYSGAPKDVVA